ncbi:MAG TPA: FtsX-like permease family protein [Planctomycetaceae bacterium]|nr:FtsX-like permease family protein [Planctomycetaceae bacterium]
MRLGDLLGLPLAALWQQKTRTVLTTLGVVFGSFVLAASLSIGQGVQDTFERETHRSDVLREIRIQPQFGESKANAKPVEVKGQMSDARRERIREALTARRRNMAASPVPLTRERLGELSRLPHVEAVVPQSWQGGYAILGKHSQTTGISASRVDDSQAREHLVAGRYFESPNEQAVVLSEYLLYRLGVVDDAALNGVLGKKLTLEFRAQEGQPGLGMALLKPDGEDASRDEIAALDKMKQELPAALEHLHLSPSQIELLRKALSGPPRKVEPILSREFTIVGVARARRPDEERNWDPLYADGDLVLPYGTATELFTASPAHIQGVNLATVLVDRDANVESVLADIHKMGLSAFAFLENVKHERLMYLLIFACMTCIAAVALLVAAMGIANTMLMSVLERMREIGIMKAVGASNGQLQLVFVVEGALIGLVGGGIGLLLAVASAYPGDAWVRGMVNRDIKIELKEPIFVFPAWLCLSVLVFAVVTTTLAAVYPARRAALVDPVTALRHE